MDEFKPRKRSEFRRCFHVKNTSVGRIRDAENDIIKHRGEQDDATPITLSKCVSLSRIERFLPTDFLFTSDRLRCATRRPNATMSPGTRVLVKLLRRIVRNGPITVRDSAVKVTSRFSVPFSNLFPSPVVIRKRDGHLSLVSRIENHSTFRRVPKSFRFLLDDEYVSLGSAVLFATFAAR